MAKKAISKLQTGGGKNHTKVIKMVKTPEGTYSFKEDTVTNDSVQAWFSKN